MDSSASQHVLDLVARFMESRRSGQRLPLDQFLPRQLADSDLVRVRNEALTVISHAARATVAHGHSSDHAATLSIAAAPTTVEQPDLPEVEGYYIIESIGAGGMGVVYEAYQESTGRRVAIKFMLAHLAASESARRRFEREVDLIARLQHPAIASIIDSGVKKGRYYYVMEFVEGRPIDEMLIPGACDVRGALSLLADVADAIDYAHQRGVLHRDLKPGNILVDASGRPRVLDFGLAKTIEGACEQRPANLTLSEAGQVLGTLGYMSPEQARGAIDQLTVRSDVYSLGAIGYELVAGKPPFTVQGALSDALKRIELQPATPPAPARLKGGREINAVLLKALEKNPGGRYATAGEFAADLRRIVRHEPVAARPIGPLQRAGRWLYRHRTAATIATIGLAAVLVVGGVQTYKIGVEYLRRVAEAERRARIQAFYQGGFRYLNINERQSHSVTLIDLLGYNAGRVERDLAGYPIDIAEVQHDIGVQFRHLREFPQALPLLEKALHTRASLLDADDERIADSKYELACALHLTSSNAVDRDRVKQLLNQSLAAGARRGADPVKRAQTLNRLGWVHKDDGDYDAALTYYGLARALRENLTDPGPLGETLSDIGYVYHKLDRPQEAIALFQQALPHLRRAYGEKHELTLATMNGLGSSLKRVNRLGEAAGYLRAALAIRSDLLGAAAHDTLISRNELGLLLLDTCETAAAEVELAAALAGRERLYHKPHDLLVVSNCNYGQALTALGRPEEALIYYDRAERLAEQCYSHVQQHPNFAAILHHRALALRESGALDEAEQTALLALQIRTSYAKGNAGIGVAETQFALGAIALANGNWSGAEAWLTPAVELARRHRPAAHWRTARMEIALARALLEQQRVAAAQPLLAAAGANLRAGSCAADARLMGELEETEARLAEISP